MKQGFSSYFAKFDDFSNFGKALGARSKLKNQQIWQKLIENEENPSSFQNPKTRFSDIRSIIKNTYESSLSKPFPEW